MEGQKIFFNWVQEDRIFCTFSKLTLDHWSLFDTLTNRTPDIGIQSITEESWIVLCKEWILSACWKEMMDEPLVYRLGFKSLQVFSLGTWINIRPFVNKIHKNYITNVGLLRPSNNPATMNRTIIGRDPLKAVDMAQKIIKF